MPAVSQRSATRPHSSSVAVRTVLPGRRVGVDARFVLFPGLMGLEAGRLHASFFDERLSTFDVDAAPDTAGLARREANRVTDGVDAFANAVDPAKAERFVNRLGPSHAWLARAFLVEADPQCIRGGVVFRKPRAEGRRRSKELWFHGHHECEPVPLI